MAQAQKRRRSSCGVDYEQECIPSKKLSNLRSILKNDVNNHIFNQTFLDIHINMDTIQGKWKNNAEKENEQKHQKWEMRKNICALRNSGGGVLKVLIYGNEDAGYINKFHIVFDDMFKSYLFEDEKFSDVYKFNNFGDIVLIFVQGSSKIVTTDTNTREPIPKGTDSIPCQRIFNFFPLEELQPPIIHYKWVPSNYEEHYPYEESDNIQFKSYSDVDRIKKVKDRLNEDIRKYVSAFTKAPEGGSVFFGITEDTMKTNTKPTVVGLKVVLRQKDMTELENSCDEIMQNKMLWLKMDCEKLNPDAIKKYYKIAFHQLKGTENGKNVIEFSVAHFEGIVFQSTDGPTAWEVNEDGVCKIQLERWYSLVNKDAKDRETNDLDTRFRKLSLSSSSLEAPVVYQIKDSVYSIRDSLFRMENPMTFTPEPLVAYLRTKCDGQMGEALQKLQMHEEFKRNRSIAVLDYNMSVILKEDMDDPVLGSCENCIFLCDVFVVGPNKLPLLISFCKICNDHNECMSRCETHHHRIAKILISKLRFHIRGLVGILSCAINISKDVNSQLNNALQQDEFYPETVRMPGSRHAKNILLSFVKTVASIPSPVKSIIEDYFLRSFIENMRTMLTLEQYQILYYNYQATRRLLVHGLPGTGKTEIIKEVIRKLSSSGVKREEILFVTEHTPLCDVVDELALCTTLTRYELNKMWIENRADLEKVKHVFVDDAQFLDQKKQEKSKMTWFEQLFTLMPVEKDGKFWIFYGNHKYRNFGPSVERVVPIHLFEQRKLRSIIRNTKKIAAFAEKYASDDDYTDAVRTIPHDAEGENVIEHHRDLSTEESRYNAFQDEIAECLKRYKAGSITVLFGKIDDIPSALSCQTDPFRRRVHGLSHHSEIDPKFINVPGHGTVKVVNASRNMDKDAIVVDSVRRYTSLERLVVIVIGIETPKSKIGYSAFTRPFAKLIVVHNISL